MDEKQTGSQAVHASHCCARHGCKYGDDGCPVVRGAVRQEYPCELCGEKADNARRALERVGRVRAELKRVAATGMDPRMAQFLLIPVDDELQLLEHLLGEEANPDPPDLFPRQQE